MTSTFPGDFFLPEYIFKYKLILCFFSLRNCCIVLFYSYKQAATAILLQYIRSTN